MTLMRRLPIIAAAFLFLGLPCLRAAQAAEDQTIKAFSTFQLQGHVMKTGVNDATVIGLLSGRFYIDTDQGPVDAGSMTCPVVVHINLKDSTQKGSGQCVFTGPQGNQAYMDLTCTGVPLVGCNGEATFTGGTGPFVNLTGGGAFLMRASLQDIKSSASGVTFQDTATGIISWRELHYKIP
jgi:hypothetical protein